MKSAFDEFIWEVSVYGEKTWLFTQLIRHLVQFAAFILFPGLFITVFSAVFVLLVAIAASFLFVERFFYRYLCPLEGVVCRCFRKAQSSNKCYSYKEEHAVLSLIRYMKLWLMNKSNASVEK